MFNRYRYENPATLWLPEIVHTKPPGIYKAVKVKDKWVLEKGDAKFKIEGKIYGRINGFRDHIWDSFSRRNGTMGCLFSGLKGSGKTMLAMMLCNKAIEQGMFVVTVSETRPDAKLLALLASLNSCVVMLDEFAKTFNHQLQQQALTLLTIQDGRKKLFILTENQTSGINTFMMNRPGRIRYHIKFERLEEEVVIEYCKDKRVDKKFVTELLGRYKKANTFTYDHLEALVEEHLNYPSMDMDELLEIMNISIISKVKVYKVLGGNDDEGNDYVINPMYVPREIEYTPYGRPPVVFNIASGTDKDGKPIPYKSFINLQPLNIVRDTNIVYGDIVEVRFNKMVIQLVEETVDKEEMSKRHPIDFGDEGEDKTKLQPMLPPTRNIFT